jgi:predicted AlkP superfamily pyrophosphatase or phosphodiesterase
MRKQTEVASAPMKTRLRRLAAAALVVVAASIHAGPRADAGGPRRVVMVSVDGLMPDYYRRADELGLKVPTLRRLMSDGAWASGVEGVLPSVTYPSHTTLITGVLPRVHGIPGNRIFDPLDRSNGAWHWFASDVRVPTLVSAARARWLTTASVSWPVSVGIGTDWNLPEFWRPNSRHEFDVKLYKAVSTPGLVDDVEISRGRAVSWPLVEADRVDAALFILSVHRPHLMLLHITDTDAAQHDHGPMSREALAAVEAADANLGRLLAAAEKTGGDTLFAVVSDHGFLPVTRTLRPNVLLREAGLITVDARGKPTDWRASFDANGGSAALRLKDPGDNDALARARALFEPRLAEAASGIQRILGPAEIAAAGGDPTGEFVLDAREGFYFTGALDGEWSSASTSRGYHGYAPDRKEMNASFLVTGPGLSKEGDLGVIRMTAIAPTLARYLGISLGPEADTPLPLFVESAIAPR